LDRGGSKGAEARTNKTGILIRLEFLEEALVA
jgi:hypothetical protein